MKRPETQQSFMDNPDYRRLDMSRNAFLQYVNLMRGICVYFDGDIEDKYEALEAMRISLDAWESPDFVERFAQARSEFFHEVDYDLVAQWRDYIQGPLYCMETNGQKALFMCEGTVFEVVSFGRTWDDMVPIVPDLVLTTLLPYDDIIVGSGLLVHHIVESEGAGVERVKREFEEGKARGVVTDSATFVHRAREINALRDQQGLDPACYATYHNYVSEINDLTFDTCYSYDPIVNLRGWNAA